MPNPLESSRTLWSASLFFSLILLLSALALLGGFFLESVWAWTAGLIYVIYDIWLLAYIVWRTHALKPSQAYDDKKLPTIGVVIPARNEAQVLVTCLEAVIKQSFAAQQIVIVDDGSTDSTADLLSQYYGITTSMGVNQSLQYKNLQLFRQKNQGKSYALNAGFPLLNTDIIVTLDADTILQKDALAAVAQAFAQQPHLAIAGGILTPVAHSKNGNKALSHFFDFFQKFEYIFSFLSRAAWMQANALLLVSGAFAAYRREVLHQLGGFANKSLVEDYEINHRMYRYAYEHHKDWSIGIVANAHATTDAPHTFKTFFHQRRRWFAGFIETHLNNFDMVASSRYGTVGRFMLPIKSIDMIQPFIGVIALGLLIYFLIDANPLILIPVFIVLISKLIIDLAFHLWGIYIYHRWLGAPINRTLYAKVIIATLLAPFSFQWLRLTSACLGWWIFITKKFDWLPQRDN